MTRADQPMQDLFAANAFHAFGMFGADAEARFDRLARLARRLFNVPIAFVSMAESSLSSAAQSGASRKRGDDMLVVRDAALDARFQDNPLVTGNPNIRFYAGCPICIGNGDQLGTLCLIDSAPREFDAADQALLLDLAQMAEQELAAMELASIDELTRTHNRRGFETVAEHTLNICKRLETPASMLYLDLDMFKSINDRFGHAEGDIALKSFSDIMQQSFRKSDVIGRLGGDEFAVLLTNTTPQKATRALQHLEQAVRLYNASANRGYELRYSVGMVQYQPSVHASLDDLMQRADMLMYENKKRQPRFLEKALTLLLHMAAGRRQTRAL